MLDDAKKDDREPHITHVMTTVLMFTLHTGTVQKIFWSIQINHLMSIRLFCKANLFHYDGDECRGGTTYAGLTQLVTMGVVASGPMRRCQDQGRVEWCHQGSVTSHHHHNLTNNTQQLWWHFLSDIIMTCLVQSKTVQWIHGLLPVLSIQEEPYIRTLFLWHICKIINFLIISNS